MLSRIFLTIISIIGLYYLFYLIYVVKPQDTRTKGAVAADIIRGVGRGTEVAATSFWKDVGKILDNVAKELRR